MKCPDCQRPMDVEESADGFIGWSCAVCDAIRALWPEARIGAAKRTTRGFARNGPLSNDGENTREGLRRALDSP